MPNDSIDKIVQTYFSSVNATPFTYKGKTYSVPRLRVSPLLFRGATCPSGCGGCCGPYTMDYIASEDPPEGVTVNRVILFDGREIPIRTIEQPPELTTPPGLPPKCRFLDRSNGRCSIHGHHGFSCDFELIRFIKREPSEKQSYPSVNLTSQKYGRQWSMKRVDGESGGQCEMIPANPETARDVYRKLLRLKEWTDYFGLETRLPKILEWVEKNVEHPENAKTLIFPHDPLGDPLQSIEEPYIYAPGTEPQSMESLGMPSFPSEPEWWDRHGARV